MNTDLQELCSLLYGINYQVFLKLYEAHHAQSAEPAGIMSAAFDTKVVVGGIAAVSQDEVLNEISTCLAYKGDESSGPIPKKLASAQFQILKSKVLDETRTLCKEANLIFIFWLKEGHPAYPVWWDFAFLFQGETHSHILIGSSSD